MNRIDRLTAILVKLQSKRTTSAQELAEHFDISMRTVYRDIRALGEAGVPIGLDQGKGYFIVDGYHLPPVMLTREEAGAVLLAGKLMEKMGDRSVTDEFNSAMTKIRSVLKGEQRDFVENLSRYIAVLQPEIPAKNEFPDHFLSDIKIALVNKRVLEFEYYSNYRDQTMVRQVEPVGLVFYSGKWHLLAHCRWRDSIRDFRTDRIMKLKLLDEVFIPRFEGDYTKLVTFMNKSTDLQQVKVFFTHNVAKLIADQRYYYGFVSEKKSDKGIEMTFMVGHLEYFARWLLMFTSSVTVLEPADLQDRVQALVQELSTHHSADIGLSY